MSSIEPNPFQEESDLQAWASEMGQAYTIGTQGQAQPISEMSDSRIDAYIDGVTQEIRRLNGLPSLPDEVEKALHRSEFELDAMTSGEYIQWQTEALEWLADHSSATIDDLIDSDPKPHLPPEL